MRFTVEGKRPEVQNIKSGHAKVRFQEAWSICMHVVYIYNV